MHVDKELFGDTFRRPPRLTPLEARAIRLALEFVGPMIAAGAHSPLDRVRAKLEETFGVFELTQTPAPHVGEEEGLVDVLTQAIDGHRLVELDYLKPEEQAVVTRTVEPYSIERRLPHWYVHTWDTERDQPRSYRLDRMRNAKVLAARSSRARASTRRSSTPPRPPASGTRRRSRAGRSRRAPARSSTAPRSRTSRSAAPSGSSARSSPTAARRSCSSRRSCARRWRSAHASSRAELRPARGQGLAASRAAASA